MGSGKNHLLMAYYRGTVRGILLAHERGRPGEDYILGGETWAEYQAQGSLRGA